MPDRKLIQIDPSGISAVWPTLREALDKMGSADGWLPEDVYACIKGGGASLFMVEVDGARVGFVILRVFNEFDGKRLHIWILHANSKVDVMAEFSSHLDDIARGVGASLITFSTTRKGWERTAPRYNFKPREIVFQRGVA